MKRPGYRQPADRVIYTHPAEASPLQAQRIKDASPAVAQSVLKLMRSAYEHEFESRGVVPEGTMARLFDSSDPARITKQQQRIADQIGRGGSYWMLYRTTEGAGHDEPLALAKTSPSRSTGMQKAGFAAPNIYVNDIAVAPHSHNDDPLQRQGFGSVILHAATVHDQYDSHNEKLTVVADTFVVGQSGPRFFGRLGFEHTDGIAEPTVFNEGTQYEVSLDMNRRETPLHYLQAELEDKLPWLAEAEVVMP